MQISQLLVDSITPMVVQSEIKSLKGLNSLCKWLVNNRELIDKHIHRSGVVLLRGFDVPDAIAFREVAASIRPALRSYTGGDSPRTDVVDKVYTSTEYPARLEVLLHNELSYAGWCPQRVFFGCMIPAQQGGETPIADGRILYQSIDPAIRQRFESKGITYLQHLWDKQGTPGVGKSWQETFESNKKADVERYLSKSEMKYQWTDLGLRTEATKPAVRIHPITGEKCWHNQANQWHRDITSVKGSVSGLSSVNKAGNKGVGEERLGNHVTYGDGSEIDPLDLRHISDISKRLEIVFPWRRGDVMVIDNVLAMHGRKPFTGPRKVLVAMA